MMYESQNDDALDDERNINMMENYNGDGIFPDQDDNSIYSLTAPLPPFGYRSVQKTKLRNFVISPGDHRYRYISHSLLFVICVKLINHILFGMQMVADAFGGVSFLHCMGITI